MANFDEIMNTLGDGTEDEKVSVKIVTIGVPPESLEITAGTTVGSLKEAQGLKGTKFSDEYGNPLKDSDVIDEDTVIFTAKAKKNG